ncbi:Coq4 family protein [Sandaracinobacteroides saxicola]|uniref:Uncharacterized protein n=1 Tax=Sandaracinobacteroides saxicola TaxID=2759707 RepID=A0A7G5IFI1_9SPHN|nr:Coq4 family protein [Sandaracinobacteroides saxicola]QMW22123.1 hypothetical protein H3309_12195 [Sandaracinobacteroides saxicola]
MQPQHFETAVESGVVPAGTPFGLTAAALMAHAAFVDPEQSTAIFDALAAVMPLPEPERLAALALPPLTNGRALPRALWQGFWDIAGAPPAGNVDPLAFTVAVVALGNHYDTELIDRCERALLHHDNVRALIATPETRMKTSDLEGWPVDSLGTDLLTMLRAQGYDLEVIDADTVVLPGDYPAQNRTNRRILQLHDVWHLVAGYGFTGAGEVAISGFQMAQFGQNYSTRFLATVATLAALHLGPIAELLLQVSFDGWRHGRATPDLLTIPWHARLGEPIAALRDQIGITPFSSPTASMMDMMEAQAKAA